MLISEISVYDFLREEIKLSESDARRYAKELALAEEKFRSEIKFAIGEEINKGDCATKKDIKDVEIKITRIETKIEKGFKEVIIWIVSAMVAIGGMGIAILKLFLVIGRHAQTKLRTIKDIDCGHYKILMQAYMNREALIPIKRGKNKAITNYNNNKTISV